MVTVEKSGTGIEASPRREGLSLRGGRRAAGKVRRLLVVGDLSALVLAVVLLGFVILPLIDREIRLDPFGLVFVAMLPVWVLIAFWFGLYHDFERRLDRSVVYEVGKVAVAAALWNWLFILLRAVATTGATQLLPLALLWILMVPLVLVAREGVRLVARGRGWARQSVALLGDPDGIAQVTERVGRHPEWGIEISLELPVGAEGPLADGEVDPLEVAHLVEARRIDRLMIVGGYSGFTTLEDRTRLVQEVVERGVSVDIVAGGPESLYSRAVNQDLEGLPVLSLAPSFPPPLALAIKRFFDVVASSAGLVVASPLMLWAAVRIRLDSPGPVLYRALRVGRDDREFEALKFRTMVEDADAQRSALREELDREGGDVLFKIEDDPRVTRAGRTLRAWSIDELPQLWNVLKGEMSMVGPRPLPPEEAAQAEALFAARTRMRPGIAGPWQALGRSSIPFDDMIRLDYAYVTGWTMSEDFRLLLKTIAAVLRRRGAM